MDLALHVVLVGQQGGELASLVQAGAEETWDLLDQGLGSQESVVLLSQFLDELLVLVQLLEVVGAHEGDALLLGLIDVELIAKHADGELRSGDMLQSENEGSPYNTGHLATIEPS